MCTDYYCRECGCEIRNRTDIGTADRELRLRSIFPGSKEKELYFETVIICASCIEDSARMMERIINSIEWEIDAAFDAFCREYEEDKNLREVSA